MWAKDRGHEARIAPLVGVGADVEAMLHGRGCTLGRCGEMKFGPVQLTGPTLTYSLDCLGFASFAGEGQDCTSCNCQRRWFWYRGDFGAEVLGSGTGVGGPNKPRRRVDIGEAAPGRGALRSKVIRGDVTATESG